MEFVKYCKKEICFRYDTVWKTCLFQKCDEKGWYLKRGDKQANEEKSK